MRLYALICLDVMSDRANFEQIYRLLEIKAKGDVFSEHQNFIFDYVKELVGFSFENEMNRNIECFRHAVPSPLTYGTILNT